MTRALLSSLVVTLVAAAASAGAGCSTVTLTPGAYGLERVALVSLHARREITVQSSELSGMLLDGTLGEEVVEMTLGDTEADLETLFGTVVPVKVAMTSKKYDLVPEALPAEDWSQAAKMLAVDIDDARTPAALGVLARDLQVEAAVVIRHEWWLQRDRLDIGTSTWAYDRCTVVVVDVDGDVVWRQTVVARAPSRGFGGLGPSFNGAGQADETRQLARDTARQAWSELRARYAQGPAQRDRKTTTTTTTPTTTTTTTAPPPELGPAMSPTPTPTPQETP